MSGRPSTQRSVSIPSNKWRECSLPWPSRSLTGSRIAASTAKARPAAISRAERPSDVAGAESKPAFRFLLGVPAFVRQLEQTRAAPVHHGILRMARSGETLQPLPLRCRQWLQSEAKRLAFTPSYLGSVVPLLALVAPAENKLGGHVAGFIERQSCADTRNIQNDAAHAISSAER